MAALKFCLGSTFQENKLRPWLDLGFEWYMGDSARAFQTKNMAGTIGRNEQFKMYLGVDRSQWERAYEGENCQRFPN